MTRPRILVGALVLAALVGCTTAPLAGGRSGGTTGQAATPVLDAAATASALATLGTKPGKDLKPVRLGPGLVPPTNRWFSGLVFGDKPQPVFPLPLSFGLDAAGFGFGVPEVKTTAKTIMGGYRPIAKIGLTGSAGWKVTGYDEASVTLTAKLVPADAMEGVTWTSSNLAVAKVVDGVVSPVWNTTTGACSPASRM